MSRGHAHLCLSARACERERKGEEEREKERQRGEGGGKIDRQRGRERQCAGVCACTWVWTWERAFPVEDSSDRKKLVMIMLRKELQNGETESSLPGCVRVRVCLCLPVSVRV
jgi:hypothetical protein